MSTTKLSMGKSEKWKPDWRVTSLHGVALEEQGTMIENTEPKHNFKVVAHNFPVKPKHRCSGSFISSLHSFWVH